MNAPHDAPLDWDSPIDADEEASPGRGGWTAIGDADHDRIRREYPGEEAATTFAAWYVLCREARYRRSLSFKIGDRIVADRAGIARNTLRAARSRLAKAGLLRFAQRRLADGNNDATEYQLRPSVSPIRNTGSTTEQPTGSLNHPPSIAHSLTRPSPIKGHWHSKRNAKRASAATAERGPLAHSRGQEDDLPVGAVRMPGGEVRYAK